MKNVKLPNELVRAASVAIATWAVRGTSGVEVGDYRHEVVTEGRRQQWERATAKGAEWAMRGVYSSCGDLPMFVAKCLGCRDESIVNRNDDFGTVAWKPGLNIVNWTRARHLHGEGVDVGDFVFVQTRFGGHICVVLTLPERCCGTATTADYGQPHGRRREKIVSAASGGPWPLELNFGVNPVQYVIDVTRLPRTALAMVPDGFVELHGLDVESDGLDDTL